jgi:hypothetical protein
MNVLCPLQIIEYRELLNCYSNCTHYFVLVTAFLVTPATHFKLDYSSEKFLMVLYSVKNTDDHTLFKKPNSCTML